jgi:hypothetical protein
LNLPFHHGQIINQFRILLYKSCGRTTGSTVTGTGRIRRRGSFFRSCGIVGRGCGIVLRGCGVVGRSFSGSRSIIGRSTTGTVIAGCTTGTVIAGCTTGTIVARTTGTSIQFRTGRFRHLFGFNSTTGIVVAGTGFVALLVTFPREKKSSANSQHDNKSSQM